MAEPLPIAVAISIAILCFLSYQWSKERNPRGLPLPPGPKGLPILGNFFQVCDASRGDVLL